MNRHQRAERVFDALILVRARRPLNFEERSRLIVAMRVLKEELFPSGPQPAMLPEPAAPQRLSVLAIQEAVCSRRKVRLNEMQSQRRDKALCTARHVAMYLAKTLTERSFPEIGRCFGGRDHSTVMHGVRRIEARRAAEPDLDAEIKDLAKSLEAVA